MGLAGEWNHLKPRKVTPPWTSAQLQAQNHPLRHPHPKSCPNLSTPCELKVRTDWSHTEKRAKGSSSRGTQGIAKSREFLVQRWPGAPWERNTPPPHP